MQIKTFVFNPIEVNTYVLFDETKECVIIDAACMNAAECEELSSFIEKQELKVTALLNTHLHFDHCFGAPFIYERYGLKVKANEADYPLIDRMNQQLEMFGFRPQSKPILLADPVNEGDSIIFGKSCLMTFHVPGHSPGSIVYYDKDGGNLYTGDVLFRESIGRADLPGGDYFTLIEGIESKLLPLPANTVIYPGHGPTSTIQHELNNNPYLK